MGKGEGAFPGYLENKSPDSRTIVGYIQKPEHLHRILGGVNSVNPSQHQVGGGVSQHQVGGGGVSA